MDPNYCRPATGTASANCRPGTRTKMSSIYQARTDRRTVATYGVSPHRNLVFKRIRPLT